MAFWNRKDKAPVKKEILEGSTNVGMSYIPLIGQMKDEKSSYRDLLTTYKIMEKDAMVKGVLDLYASFTTQPDPQKGHNIWVECSNAKLKGELEDFLYNTLKAEDKAFTVAYRLARDGAYYYRTYSGMEDWYFEPVDDLENLWPLEDKGKVCKYFYQPDKEGKIYPVDEFVGNTMFTSTAPDKLTLKTDSGEELHYKSTRGDSLLRGSIIAWKVLSTIEDIIMITRVSKTNMYRLVKINVGNASKKEADQIIEKTKKLFKTREAINLIEGMYRSDNNPVATSDNIYIPTREGVGDVTIEEIGGTYEMRTALDLDYFVNKWFASVHCPKNFLGFDGESSSVLGDNSLVRLDENFARFCKMVQTAVKGFYMNCCNFYLKNTGRSLDKVPEFKICMTGISSQEEKTRREEFGFKLDNAQKFIEISLTNFPNLIEKNKLFSYVYNDMLGVNTSEIANVKTEEVPAINYGVRGTGQKQKGDRFFRTVTTQMRSPEGLESYDITLVSGGRSYKMNEVLDRLSKSGKLNEVSYKELKQRVQTTDPDRVKKANRLTTTYLGLNRNGDLMFKTSSGTTPGKFWYQTVRLLDLQELIDKFGKDGDVTDKEIVQVAIDGDIAVYCNDPSFKFWAWQWMATVDGYGIKPEDRAPTIRNTELKGAVCKHLMVVLKVLPFWTNKIVGDLKKQFFRDRPEGTKAKDKVEYEKGKKAEWKNNPEEDDENEDSESHNERESNVSED